MAEKEYLALIDLDGTLVDSALIYTPLLSAFSERHDLPCDTVKFSRGYKQPLVHDLGWGVPLEKQPELCLQLRTFHVQQMRDHKRFIPKLWPGLEKALPEMDQHLRMVLLTVNTRDVAQEYLWQNGVSQFISAQRTLCCTRERGYGYKPDPAAVHCLLNETGYTKEKSVIIGDSGDDDIQMAHNAGVRSIGAGYGTHSREILLASKPTLIVDNTLDLPAASLKVFTFPL